jgi:hypothetical protein
MRKAAEGDGSELAAAAEQERILDLLGGYSDIGRPLSPLYL